MQITRNELIKIHNELTQSAVETMRKKNADYATETDVFRNFRMFGGLGILVRMYDKLARLCSFEEKGSFAVEDEKLADTIQDLINYAVIYYAFVQESKPAPSIRQFYTDEEYCGSCRTVPCACDDIYETARDRQMDKLYKLSPALSEELSETLGPKEPKC